MGAGQVPVEHDHVIPGHREGLKRVIPVKGHVDRHALPPQPGRYGFRQNVEILGDQHSHGSNDAIRGGVSQVSASGTVLAPAPA